MRAAALIALLLYAPPLAAQDFYTLKGHGGPIMDIAVSPSGQIATASFDNAVGVWRGLVPIWFDGHEAAVTTVRFMNDDIVLSGGDDFALRLWDISAPGNSRIIGHHTAKILAIDVSAQLIASASWDARIGLWPVGAGEPVFLKGHRQGVNDIAFSADGTRLYSVSVDGTIRIWDTATGDEVQKLTSHGFGINEMVLNEADGWLAYGAIDGGTRFIDPHSGKVLADFTLGRRPILAMSYDKASKQLAVGDGEGYIMVIDTTRFEITRDFRATKRGPIWALAFSSNGQNIHAGGIEDILYSWPIETLDAHGQMGGAKRSFLEDPKTLPNGERQFKRKCSICHALGQSSARKAGPSLHDLFGRRAGTVTDYSYSDVLKGSDIIWSEATINGLFDIGPDHFIPGSKMPMQRIVKQQDRSDLIEYLRDATSQGGN
ncbi:c-type cytochrome [Planktotalea arctica]|uniref:c-type cytochrome n=1 Tax=Planktotalea arctica TaxID=1481893 RepID=UPI00321B531A